MLVNLNVDHQVVYVWNFVMEIFQQKKNEAKTGSQTDIN